MQDETGQLGRNRNKNKTSWGTIILCSVYTIFGLGVLSYAGFELYQLKEENQRLWSDLNVLKEQHILHRRQIEAEKLKNQRLKNMTAGLGLEINQMKNRITHFQSVLSQVHNKTKKLVVDYRQVIAENRLLLANLSHCQAEKQNMSDENEMLQSRLNEHHSQHTLLETQLKKERHFAKTFVIYSDLTSCKTQAQPLEGENGYDKACVESILLNVELPNEIEAVELLSRDQNRLQANLSLVQGTFEDISARNRLLQSELALCHSKKQEEAVKKDHLVINLNEFLLNNTLLGGEVLNVTLMIETLSDENQVLSNTNQRLELNISFIHKTNEKLSVKSRALFTNSTYCSYIQQEKEMSNSALQLKLNAYGEIIKLHSDVLLCRSEIQQKERDQEAMHSKLSETLANKTSLEQRLNEQKSRRNSLSVENQLLQTNLTTVQHLQAILYAQNNSLHQSVTSCLAEISQEKDWNDNLKSNLDGIRGKNLLLNEKVATERETHKNLTAENELLENSNKILLLNLTETQNISKNLYTERHYARLKFTFCQTWTSNVELEVKLLKQKLNVQTAQDQNQLLKSRLINVQDTWKDILADNDVLQQRLTSCHSEVQVIEDKKTELLLKLYESQAANDKLMKALHNTSLTRDSIQEEKELLRKFKQVLELNISVSLEGNANLSAENNIILENLDTCLANKQRLKEQNLFLDIELEKAKTSMITLIKEWKEKMLEKVDLLEEISLLQEDVLNFKNLSELLPIAIGQLSLQLIACEANKTMLVEENENEIMEKDLIQTDQTSCLSKVQQEQNESRTLQLELNKTQANVTWLEGEFPKESSIRDKLSAEISALQAKIVEAGSIIYNLSVKESLLQSTLRDCNDSNVNLEQKNSQVRVKIPHLQSLLDNLVNVVPPLEEDVRIQKDNITAIKAHVSALVLEQKQFISILLAPILHVEKFCDLDTLQCQTCPDGWWKFKSRCYSLTEDMTRWKTARYICLGQGSDLAIVHNIPEQIFLASLVNNFNIRYILLNQKFEGAWVGLIDCIREGRFMWIDNRDTTFTYWSEGNPNNMITGWDTGNDGQDCSVFVPTRNMSLNNWDDSQCRNKRHYICESGTFVMGQN